MALDLYIVGLSHHTAPVEVRERLALDNGTFEALLEVIGQPSGVHEAVVLSTCNRVEVVTCCETDPNPVPEIEQRLMAVGGLSDGQHAEHMFRHQGREAVRHVFRVASSLDSMVVGEPQILGQLKEQFAASTAANGAGPILNRVFHKSFSVAKRVRNETGVAARAVSVASVAADLAGRIFEDLSDRTVLLLGAGEIGEALGVRYLLEGGLLRAGDSVRLNVQLVDAQADETAWAASYDRRLSVATLLSIQAEIATTIAHTLRAAVTPEEALELGAARIPRASRDRLMLWRWLTSCATAPRR